MKKLSADIDADRARTYIERAIAMTNELIAKDISLDLIDECYVGHAGHNYVLYFDTLKQILEVHTSDHDPGGTKVMIVESTGCDRYNNEMMEIFMNIVLEGVTSANLGQICQKSMVDYIKKNYEYVPSKFIFPIPRSDSLFTHYPLGSANTAQ